MSDEENPEVGWVTALAWSPDGALLATGSTDGETRIVDAGSGDVRQRLQLDGPVWVLAWSPDSTLLAVGCTGGAACIIDAGSGEVRYRVQSGDTTDDQAPTSGIAHGEEELQDLQDHIDQVRSQTGEAREQLEAPEDDASESDVPPPG